MNVTYKDFTPSLQQEGFLKRTIYESFQDCLHRANQWIQEQNPSIINIETVVLPNIWDRDEAGSEDPELVIGRDMMSSWHQLVRVWYEA